jgi:hypothetical protein
LKIRESNTRGEDQVELQRSITMDFTTHSVRYEVLQLLEQKERELGREKSF